MITFEQLLKRKIVLLDGATGTNLLDCGLKSGESPAILNLKNPDAVYRVQKAYVGAGSNAIFTNTFSANPLNFARGKYRDVIRAGIGIALKAAEKRVIVIGDIGPLGIMLKPYGNGDFNDAYKIYYDIFKTFKQSKINIFVIETFNSIIEAKAAFLAARNFSNNIFVSFSFQNTCRTLLGDTPESVAITFDKLGAKAIGVNCTTPETALEVISRMAKVTAIPLIAKPNAGNVVIDGNKARHTISDNKLAEFFPDFVRAGANFIGGCCGTTPAYIRMLREKLPQLISIVPSKQRKFRYFLVSPQMHFEINNDSRIIVGERLNPSGRKKLSVALKKGDYSIYGEESKLQENAGAQTIDVNAFVPELDERITLLNCIYEVIKNCKLPVFIDTQDIVTARTIMEVYPGIGVYNSIPARPEKLRKFLPLLKSFGFKAVISLVGKRIPKTCEERLANANIAIKIAQELDFPVQDLIFDPLVFSVATEPEQVKETLKAVGFLHKKGYKTILGISNVSYGCPERSALNSAMLIAALKTGLNFALINPFDERTLSAFQAGCALFGGNLRNYMAWTKTHPIIEKQATTKSQVSVRKVPDDNYLMDSIVQGDTKSATDAVLKLIDSDIPVRRIIDEYVFGAMQIVGDNYEKGRFFIPDLLRAAESTKVVLEIIKKRMKRSVQETEQQRKRVVLATVQGDIHDIGKNIVGMVFESAGYEVIDLGKDVSANRILQSARKFKPIVIGLSALLTTTMPEMEKVIKLLRKNGIDTPVIIGGPNVSDDYAKKIGAFAAVQNAFEGLRVIKKIG